jgi:acyl-CoA reductase-like NAD-dependent aldehyde dehydrogenase
MQPGVTEENLAEHSAEFYRGAAGPGKVALVLGAGNVASVGPGDLAQKLFVEGQVCLFKHNPVVEYLGPILEEAFGALIRDGFVRMTGGGPEVGDSLCRHPGIDEIHLTGSDRTYEAIVFGTGEEGRRRKAAGARLLEKRFTCELGSATPMIVAPGRWSEADIRFHAENIVTQMTVNCGFLCLSTRVLVLHREWPQAGALLDAVRAVLTSEPQRRAYYPAAEARYDEVMAANRSAEAIGPRRPGVLPYTLVAGIDPEDRANPCFATECFLPVLAQTSLPGRDAAEFLRNAVEFCNERLWGTLSASLVVHPETERAMGGAVEEAIEGMRFGTVGVNQWAALGYMWGTTTWGAYPGHTPGDIQSGVGAVHNACLFDRPEKSVVYGPFRMWPKPAWFVTNRQTHHVFRRMFELELEPGVGKAARVVMAAMGG